MKYRLLNKTSYDKLDAKHKIMYMDMVNAKYRDTYKTTMYKQARAVVLDLTDWELADLIEKVNIKMKSLDRTYEGK